MTTRYAEYLKTMQLAIFDLFSFMDSGYVLLRRAWSELSDEIPEFIHSIIYKKNL